MLRAAQEGLGRAPSRLRSGPELGFNVSIDALLIDLNYCERLAHFFLQLADDVVHRDGADGMLVAVDHGQAAQIVFVEKLENIFVVASAVTETSGSNASSAMRCSESASSRRAMGTVPAERPRLC